MRYDVTRRPQPDGAEANVSFPDPSARVAPKQKGFNASILVTIYAIAVGVTPEFDFLGIPKVRITDLLLPVILLVCMGSKRESKATLPMAGFFAFIFFWNLCCLFAWGKANVTPGLFYLAKRLIYFLVVYSTFTAVRTVKDWNAIVRTLVFASPILSLSVLHQLHSNLDAGGILATGEGMRASGIIANQETSTAFYIVVISCVALGAWDAFKDARWRLGALVSLSTGCMAIFATGSRGGLASVALALVLTLFQSPARAVPILTLGAIVAPVAWVVTPPELQQRLAGILPETQVTVSGVFDGTELPEYGNSSITDRVLVARKAWQEVIPKAGLLGLGAGFKKLGAVDDFFLTEWIYHGLIGLVLFMALVVGMAVACFRIGRTAKDPAERGVAIGAATALVVVTCGGIQSDTFYLIRPMEALALLLGLVAARRAMNR